MSNLDPGLTALSTWYTQRIASSPVPPFKGKALLKIEGGILKPVDENTLSGFERLLCRLSRFFGVGNYALHNISATAQTILSKQPKEQSNIPLHEIVAYFNTKVTEYNAHRIVHLWRQQASPLEPSIPPPPKTPPIIQSSPQIPKPQSPVEPPPVKPPERPPEPSVSQLSPQIPKPQSPVEPPPVKPPERPPEPAVSQLSPPIPKPQSPVEPQTVKLPESPPEPSVSQPPPQIPKPSSPVESKQPSPAAPISKPSVPKEPITLVKERVSATGLSTEHSVYLKGYTLVGTVFDACEIYSDGHCMFRAYATGLLDAYKNKSNELRVILQKIFEGPLFPEPRPRERIREVLSSLDLLQAGLSPEKIMNEEACSTAWIAILRMIASRELNSILKPLKPLILSREESNGEEEIAYANLLLTNCTDTTKLRKALLSLPEDIPRPTATLQTIFASLDLVDAKTPPADVIKQYSAAWITLLKHENGAIRTILDSVQPTLLKPVTEKALMVAANQRTAATYKGEIAQECAVDPEKIDETDIDKYIAKLEALETGHPLFGGTPALRALARVFPIVVGLISIYQTQSKGMIEGKVVSEAGERAELSHLKEQGYPCDIFLLQDGNHYNVGFKRAK